MNICGVSIFLLTNHVPVLSYPPFLPRWTAHFSLRSPRRCAPVLSGEMPRTDVYQFKRCLTRMSWDPRNLFNLYTRSKAMSRKTLTYSQSHMSLFQMRWQSKALRWFLPDTIPDGRPRRPVQRGDDKAALEDFARRKTKAAVLHKEMDNRGMAPVGSLMFSEVERRLDVFVFRCCFAHSVYEARRLVIQGHVSVNGKQNKTAGMRLAPGDLISVNPKAIRFFFPPEKTGYVPIEPDAEEKGLTPFALPAYASPWIYIPPYIEPSFIGSPYSADGPVMRFAWEWYVQRRPRMRSKKQLARMPTDRTIAPEVIERGRRSFRRDIERIKKVAATARSFK
ncbi:hypothetical protein BDQ17DRAFT_1354294 [Cyathus striatus]|nr:hypothetical protein BDQ17DRAFT_1354294 [Cyathus striatus]